MFKEVDAMREVERRLDRMLVDCSSMYRMATQALFGEVDASSIREELWSLDKGVNKAERAVRRELLIHATVSKVDLEQGLVLAYMAVAKDIERIGDYCKNLWDLADHGVDLSGAEDSTSLREHADGVARFLEQGAEVFRTHHEKGAHSLIPALEVAAAEHDDLVFGYVESDGLASVMVPRALYFRFLKRIVAHLTNVLTSLVMPLDRIDYYKEPKTSA